MSSKKIDRIYQEKLKDLEMNPSPEVWNKIEASLATQKKSKKRFVWWFASAGTAAAILLMILLNITEPNESIELAEKEPVELKEKKNSNKEEVTKILTENTQKQDEVSVQEEVGVVMSTKVASTKSLIKSSLATEGTAFVEKELIANTKSDVAEILRENKQNLKAMSENSEKESGSIEKTIKATKTEKGLLDLETHPKKSLEATLLAEKEEEKREGSDNENVLRNWSIAPVISQYVYNSFSDNSTIDNRLNNAEKSGQSNLSYGVNVAYSVSGKLKIRAGVHRISMGQRTQKQSFNTVFSRVSSYENTKNRVVEINTNRSDSGNITVGFADVETAQQSDIQSFSGSNSQLEQRFGYIEIPIDVNYNLFAAEQFSVYLSGGFSTLFLTENSLIEGNSQYAKSLGGATNVNELNFSLNFGTDLEYHFSDQWFINLYPSIKIQTQTFSRDSNQPYLLGISSGINYKF